MSLRSYFVTPVIKPLFGLLKQKKKSPNPIEAAIRRIVSPSGMWRCLFRPGDRHRVRHRLDSDQTCLRQGFAVSPPISIGFESYRRGTGLMNPAAPDVLTYERSWKNRSQMERVHCIDHDYVDFAVGWVGPGGESHSTAEEGCVG